MERLRLDPRPYDKAGIEPDAIGEEAAGCSIAKTSRVARARPRGRAIYRRRYCERVTRTPTCRPLVARDGRARALLLARR
jgi:hypothetical protein